MEIYFDRKTVAVLKTIHRSGDKGVTWANLQKKYGEDIANLFLLESLSRVLYTVTKDQDGNWLDIGPKPIPYVTGDFRSFCTSKGNELLERRSFNFWKWVIPLLISVAALVVSCISLWQQSPPPAP